MSRNSQWFKLHFKTFKTEKTCKSFLLILIDIKTRKFKEAMFVLTGNIYAQIKMCRSAK